MRRRRVRAVLITAALAAAALAAAAAPASAIEWRSISAVMANVHDVHGAAVSFEQVLLARVSTNLTLVARFQREHEFTWRNNIPGLGAVFGLGPRDYLEVAAGYGLASDGRDAWYGNAEYTHEGRGFEAACAWRFRYADAYDYYQIFSPSIRMTLLPRLRGFLKLFLSLDAARSLRYSAWTTVDWGFLPEAGLVLGGVFGSADTSFDSSGLRYTPGNTHALMFGFRWNASEKTQLRALVEEYFSSSPVNVRMSLVVDTRF